MNNEDFIVVNLQSFGSTQQNVETAQGNSSAAPTPRSSTPLEEVFSEPATLSREIYELVKRV